MDIDVVDPGVREALRKLPAISPESRFARSFSQLAMRFLPTAKVDGVVISVIRDRGAQVRLYRPETVTTDAALLWIHGGGLVIGAPVIDDRLCAETARELGITVVSARYRLAPDHPFPAPLDDCLAAFDWLVAEADVLGIDPARIVVGGQSAGGGLAAALVQRLHDAGRPVLAQWLLCPMLDDRTAARTDVGAEDHFVWNNRANRFGWRSYLAQEPGAASVPDYASPARRTDLTGLPPAWVSVGDIELFFDEDVDYARRLDAAGVPVTLDVTPAAPHGFESWASTTPLAQALLARARAWLKDAVA